MSYIKVDQAHVDRLSLHGLKNMLARLEKHQFDAERIIGWWGLARSFEVDVKRVRKRVTALETRR